jgi:E3 ubiquitin-protein ligase RNF25
MRATAGLSDAQVAQVAASLRAEAGAMPGELVLGHLCETALDLLTELNAPEGSCAFCLDPLLPSPSPVLKLACFHCFHRPCFAAWWRWRQAQQAAREAQLREEYSFMAEEKLEEEGIRQEEVALPGAGGGGAPRRLYVVHCPACRAPVPPADLAHALPQLEAGGAGKMTGGRGASPGARGTLAQLDAATRQAVLHLQRRFGKVLAAQRSCNGLVVEAVSVSLEEMQRAADSGRAAAQAAAAPAAAPPAADGAGASAPPAAANMAAQPGPKPMQGKRGGLAAPAAADRALQLGPKPLQGRGGAGDGGKDAGSGGGRRGRPHPGRGGSGRGRGRSRPGPPAPSA